MMPRRSLADDCPWCPAKAGETCQRYEYDHPGHPKEKGLDAAPVEGPRCGASREYVGFTFTCFKERGHEGRHEGNTQDRRQPSHSWSVAPVEGVERVTDDAPARVEFCGKYSDETELAWSCSLPKGHGGNCNPMTLEELDECASPEQKTIVAQPVTDDWPAETIPDDLKDAYARCNMVLSSGYPKDSFAALLIERIGRREALLDKFSENNDRLCEREARAETRIEVLEAALRGIVASDDVWEMLEIARAALAAPSGTPSR